MTTIRKVIGRLPMLIGEWQSNYREGQGYMKNNRVLIFNSELQSKIDNNTYVPATQNSETGVITFDTTHWIVVNDGRSTIGLDEKLAEKYVKPVGGIPTTDLAFTPATLDSNGLVPAENLPSYVDDIVELLTMSSTAPATCAKGDYYYNTSTGKIVRATGTNTWGTSSATNTIPEKGKIYYNLADEKSYRWSSTQMVLSGADLQIGTVTGTAADGGTVNDHINNTSNPHSVTKSQVGLGNVVNTGDSATPTEGGTTKFTTGGAYTELAKKVDKVSEATAGHLAGLNASGDITDSGVSAEELVKKTENITWADLKAKRDNSQLIPGRFYRIIDYQCTTTQADTQSAGHQFDIIVRADDVNILNENAFAAKHSGDTYFTNAGAKLEAWQLKYTLDNKYWSLVPHGEQIVSREQILNYIGTIVVDGTTYYEWEQNYCSLSTSVGDTLYYYDSYRNHLYDNGFSIEDCIPASDANGKGTIYWMKDEFNNECSYDFKNIQFKFTSAIENSGIVANVFYYTFSFASGDNDATITDHSLVKYCIRNKVIYMKENNDKVELPFNVFRCNNASERFTKNIIIGNNIRNTFSSAQYNEIIGVSCNNNSFGSDCFNNKIYGIECSKNKFYERCASNSMIGESKSNILGIGSSGNKFEDGRYITLGGRCAFNTFESDCNHISLGERCRYNTFGTSCKYITFGTSESTKSYCQYIIVENGNQYIYLDCSATTSYSAYFQNVKIAQGVNNSSTYKTITHTTAGDTFQTIYKPANSVEVSV